jgi:hypothetical protein
VEVDRGAAASLYSVKWEGEEEDELTRFLEREHGIYCSKREENSCIDSRCRAHCQRQTFLQKLGQDLLDATLDYGFDTRFFSPSDNYTHPIGAFEHGTYRLYGLRFSSDLFIAGNGGIKLTRSIAEDLHLLQCLEDIKEVRDRILIRLQEEYSQNDLPVRYGRRYLPPKLRSY